MKSAIFSPALNRVLIGFLFSFVMGCQRAPTAPSADFRGYGWVGIYAKDMKKLGTFYEEVVGLGFIQGNDHSIILDAGSHSLFEIFPGGAEATSKGPLQQSVVIGFFVDDVEVTAALFKTRGLEAVTKIDSYLGTRWIYFSDPEGNRFEIKDLRG